MEKTESQYLTESERKYFDALARYDSVKSAAQHLGMQPQSLYNFLYNLKRKYHKRRGWINAIIAQKRRNKLIKRILTERVPLEAPEYDDEEDY
jgi:hypothetical protein